MLIDSKDGLQPIDKQERPVEVFRTELSTICGRFCVEPLQSRKTLSSHLSVRRVNGLELAQIGLDANSVVRSREDIRADPADYFFLILQREGSALLRQNSVEELTRPGDMFLVDAAVESQFFYHGKYSLQLSVHLPRDEMLHRFGDRITGGQSIARNDPIGLSMRALLIKLCAEDRGPQGHIVEAFYSVFGALLEERASQREDHCTPDRRVIQRALMHIAEHYRDAEFSTTQLAALCGVSLRRLQRAFQLVGETPHSTLQAFRLKSARAMLTRCNSQNRPPTVISVAFKNGFSDLSTFYRLYRKAYAEPPGHAIQTAAMR